MITKNNKGNVLFIILIAVALFAALTYVVSSSFRGGTSDITDEKARVGAGELLRSMDEISQGFHFLWTQRECSMDDISFEHPATAPHDCDIFHPDGASISYPDNLLDYQDNPAHNVGIFTFIDPDLWVNGGGAGDYYVDGLGTTAQELMIRLIFADETICKNINKLVNPEITVMPYVPASATNPVVTGNDPLEAELAGKMKGCRRQFTATYGDIHQIFFVIQEF